MLLRGARQRLAGTIRFVNDDSICQFKNAFLDALKLIAATRQHQQ